VKPIVFASHCATAGSMTGRSSPSPPSSPFAWRSPRSTTRSAASRRRSSPSPCPRRYATPSPTAALQLKLPDEACRQLTAFTGREDGEPLAASRIPPPSPGTSRRPSLRRYTNSAPHQELLEVGDWPRRSDIRAVRRLLFAFVLVRCVTNTVMCLSRVERAGVGTPGTTRSGGTPSTR